MAKVITFSRVFPSYHPRKGEPTYFVEKIWKSLGGVGRQYTDPFQTEDYKKGIVWGYQLVDGYKYHTIRSGDRFKEGDWFSPRVWSGKPYNSKQIIIAPDIQVKKVFDFQIEEAYKDLPLDYDTDIIINHKYYHYDDEIMKLIAKNDGLSLPDLLKWFLYPKPFDGQVICWHESIEY
jgi:hypothetical protein